MGFLSRLASLFGFKKNEANILVVGLDNSGKSTILNFLKQGDKNVPVDTVPTIGLNVEKMKAANIEITAFDMSGQGRYRPLWEQYYKECQGIIFVVDSSDKLRVVVARDELERMMKHPDLERRNVPVLFFANKMDKRDAVSSVKVSTLMGLNEVIHNKNWHIVASNAINGDGIDEGITWLADVMKSNMATKK
ncbi:ADP-ribosylation factor-like protein 6 [Mactra antiquata]